MVAFTLAIVLAIYRWLEPARATAPRITLS